MTKPLNQYHRDFVVKCAGFSLEDILNQIQASSEDGAEAESREMLDAAQREITMLLGMGRYLFPNTFDPSYRAQFEAA